MGSTFKWGIIGPGIIANTFATSIGFIPEASITAVGGRNMGKVNEFADKFNIANRYNSYEEVIADKEVNAVYIALPNTLHYEYIKKAIDGGKAVLCEKPLVLNSVESEKIIAYAREKKVFLMEAVWTRFLPIHKVVKEWINSGEIGDVRMIRADFAFNVPWPAGDRHINKELGGGAIMDVGVYLISYAHQILGEHPEKVVSVPYIDETGVDVKNSFIMSYKNGTLVSCNSSVITDMPQDCYIFGSKGHIVVKDFWRSTYAYIEERGEKVKEATMPFTGNGYEEEAIEVMNCVNAGKTESDILPLDDSLAYARIITNMRKEWNLLFPGEELS
ncbi:MAG TPA: Gfo/Idh/MocA family oxidoreductase [Clostridiales bacterium]|nr:Gfo/Idh/MocA family oxidoreductase [Clostridiales bacterium]